MSPEHPGPETPKQSGFRWRVVPTTLCGIFGGVAILGSLGKAGMMLYVLVRFGAVVPHPDTPSLNMAALTMGNCLEVIGSLCAGAVLLVASTRWWRQRWKLAILLTAVSFGASASIGAVQEAERLRNATVHP